MRFHSKGKRMHASFILLPYQERYVCPLCSIKYYSSSTVFGTPLVYHVGKKFEDVLLSQVNILASDDFFERFPNILSDWYGEAFQKASQN